MHYEISNVSGIAILLGCTKGLSHIIHTKVKKKKKRLTLASGGREFNIYNWLVG